MNATMVRFDDRNVYYDYDDVQDMLYITFSPSVGPTYYSDAEGLPGVMLRYDGQDDQLVGVTVHNVRQKLQRWLVEDLCRRFVPSEHGYGAVQPDNTLARQFAIRDP
jgi:hypothetical protein